MPPFPKAPKRMLVISLSNVGDAFLTAPLVKALRNAYPAAALSVLVGEGAKDVFAGDPRLQEVIVYDKRMSLREKWRFVRHLRERRFDLVVDLRNTLFPLLLGSPRHTPLFRRPPRSLFHQMDRHLWKLSSLGLPEGNWREGASFHISPASEQRLRDRLTSLGIRIEDPFILLSPGSKSSLKRWPEASFAALSDRLYQEKKMPVLFIGAPHDQPMMDRIAFFLREPCYSLVGQTSIQELAAVVRASRLLVTNDNATLHVASLVGTPTVAIFGPTNPRKYGPRAERSRVVRKELFCSPCEKAECPYHHECMEELPVEEVYQACLSLL